MGPLAAQVNPFVLRYAVDTVQNMLNRRMVLAQGADLLLAGAGLLLGKELINTGIQFGQKFYGEKIRISVSTALSEDPVRKVPGYQLSFYAGSGNQTGKLQTRIDRGVESLTKLVQNFFIRHPAAVCQRRETLVSGHRCADGSSGGAPTIRAASRRIVPVGAGETGPALCGGFVIQQFVTRCAVRTAPKRRGSC